MLNFPYGVSDFHRIRTEPYVYLDRTACIADLEAAGRQLIFLRPRRFGKSLLLSTLANYYDINTADEFENLFGDLAVGKHPTSEHNQYLILRWDFSKVSGQGDIVHIKQSLFNHINQTIKDFIARYKHLLQDDVDIMANDALASLESLTGTAHRSGQQIYLLIDEYDNFANEVLMHDHSDKQRYRDLLEGEGIVKSLFKMIKGSASEGKISRVFITGVSPLVLSDVTSGYNVATSIFLDPLFNDLCGISHNELTHLVNQTLHECGHTEHSSDILDTMKQFYNGYRFCNHLDLPLVYNPTLCFYFLRHYQRECEAPRQMMDGNLATDAGRIRYIAQLPRGAEVLEHIMDEQNLPVLSYLETQFGVEQLNKLQYDPRYMVSLMYFFGMLTIRDIVGLGDLKLGVPNNVIYKLYIEELLQQTLPQPSDQQTVEQLGKAFYQSADIEPIADFIEQKYFAVFNNRDYRWSNELTVKTAFLTLLFNDIWYIMDSESAINRQYSDLVMIIRSGMRRYATLKDIVLEFKYIPLQSLDLTGEEVRKHSRTQLMQLPSVKKALSEAHQQLITYRDALNTKYQEPHRLRCIAVISLGFDRIVWQSI